MVNIDWEKEYDRDYIFMIERQKDIEASWQEWEEKNNRKPAKIKLVYETNNRRSSFRRITKKVLQLRSHIPTKTITSRY